MKHRDGYNFLETMMEKARPSSGYVNLALLMSKTVHNVVITTNFDHLLEDSLVQYAQAMPMVIGHEKLAPYALHQISRPTVIKIHRDLLLDPINSTEELDRLNVDWEDVLDHIFSQYHPVFIGYAGNDNSVMDFLNENVSNFKSSTWAYPYWMIYGSQKPEGKVKKFLEGADGYLIRHKGFDQVFALLCKAVNLMPPDEETFFKKAKEQYKVIQDSIGEILKEYENSATKEIAPVVSDLTMTIENSTEEHSPSTAYIKSMMFFSNGENGKALEEANRAVQLEPDSARYHQSLGIVLYALKRYDEALAEIQRAVELEPDNARYHDNLRVILQEINRYDEALAEAHIAIELEPDNAKYHDSLSDTLHAMQRYDEALTAVQKAVELEPDNAKYYNSLSTTLHAMRRYDEALVAEQKAVELEPDNAEYHDSLSATFHAMQRYDEALAAVQKAVELEPGNAEYHSSLSTTLHAMNQYDEALAEAQKAVELKPDNALYRIALGVALSTMQRYDEALVEKQKAVELKPDNALYHSSLGLTLYAMQRYDEALVEMQKAVELKQDSAEYHIALGLILHNMQRYGEALLEMQKAIELEPDNALYHDSLGMVLNDMQCYDEAMVEIQKAMDLSQNNETEKYIRHMERIKKKIDDSSLQYNT